MTEVCKPRIEADPVLASLGGQAGRRCVGQRNVARLGAHVGTMWEDNRFRILVPCGGQSREGQSSL